MSYRRRSSALHSAGAGAGAAFCAALALAALMLSNPIVLAALGVTVAGAALGAGVGRELARSARFTLPFAIAIVILNALLTRNGLTVIIRLGDLPLVGHTDVTLEATVYGLILGLRAVVVIACGALYTAAVDPDEMLALLRPLSFRSALTATLATRMVPVLLRDPGGWPRLSAAAPERRPRGPPCCGPPPRACSTVPWMWPPCSRSGATGPARYRFAATGPRTAMTWPSPSLRSPCSAWPLPPARPGWPPSRPIRSCT